MNYESSVTLRLNEAGSGVVLLIGVTTLLSLVLIGMALLEFITHIIRLLLLHQFALSEKSINQLVYKLKTI